MNRRVASEMVENEVFCLLGHNGGREDDYDQRPERAVTTRIPRPGRRRSSTARTSVTPEAIPLFEEVRGQPARSHARAVPPFGVERT